MDQQHITLDKPRLAMGVGGLLAVALMFAMLASGRVDGGMMIIAGAMGLVMGGYSGWLIWARGVGFCPDCGMRLTGLYMDDNEGRECRSCGGYVESTGGLLSMAGADALSSTPTFRASCPERIDWPEGCCVCGAPATRQIAAKLEEKQDAPLAGDVAVRAATLGTMKLEQTSTHSVQVPHCSDHDDGAELVRARDEDGAGLELLFRSNAYCQRFRELNEHNA